MKLTRHRLIAAGVLGLAAVALPVSVPFAENLLGGGPAASSTLASPDVITYTQASTGTTVTFTPGNGSAATTQTLTPSGKCGTPTVSGGAAPILGMSGALYAPDHDSDTPGEPDNDLLEDLGTPTPVPVGSYKQHTGVCAVPPSWEIQNFPPIGEEGLYFTVLGSNSLIGTGRIFTDAQISIQREDWWPVSSIPVELLELEGGAVVGSQICTISGPAGTTITADTNGNSVCTGSTSVTGFDTVEIGMPWDFTAASVVGTSTFTLAPQVCGGGAPISSTGPVTASLSINAGGGCESYTGFTSTGTSLTYDEYSGGVPEPFTVDIQWPDLPDCQPSPDVASQYPGVTPLPLCPVTQFTVNGTTYYDQSFCSHATTALPLCTQQKEYTYVNVGGTDETQINEVWVGDIDWNISVR